MMLAILVLVLGLAMSIALVWKWRARRVVDSPRKLFSEICRAHGLTRKQRRVLLQLTAKRQLKNPCLVLMDANQWVLDPKTDQHLCQSKKRTLLMIVQRILFTPSAADASF